MHLLASTLHQGCYRVEFMRLMGNLCQEVEAKVSRSPRWRPQARKCLERRVVARRIARDEAWSDPGNPHGRGARRSYIGGRSFNHSPLACQQ
jgi:hypothetical protein